MNEMQTSYPLTKKQLKDWTKVVLREFPNEACAYIVNGKIFPVRNVSVTPKTHFAVAVIDRFEAEKGTITGFLHSHCGTPEENGQKEFPSHWPSSADMAGWLADNTRWGISACDGENVTEPIWFDENYIAPLFGRPFIGGIWDCYTAIRDWYRVEFGITLINVPRGIDKWVSTFDMYNDNFGRSGFYEVPMEEAQHGDVLLMTLNSGDKPIHGAIYINPMTMFQQLNSEKLQTVSGYTDLSRWGRHICKVARYGGPDA